MATTPTKAAALLDPASYATTLVVVAHDEWGSDGLHWDPRTLRLAVDEAAGRPVPEANYARLMAGIALVTTDRFFVNLPDFLGLCRVLAGALLNPALLDFPAVDEIAWGCTEAWLQNPPRAGQSEFSPEIRAYIGQAVAREGLLEPPDVLQLARGLDPGRKARALAAWADDPLLVRAITAVEAARTRELTTLLRDNAQRLLEQLGRLDLDHGSTAHLAARLRSTLRSA